MGGAFEYWCHANIEDIPRRAAFVVKILGFLNMRKTKIGQRLCFYCVHVWFIYTMHNTFRGRGGSVSFELRSKRFRV